MQNIMNDLPNIAMADTFMKIFGYKRIKPTDKELKLKYKKREREVDAIKGWLDEQEIIKYDDV